MERGRGNADPPPAHQRAGWFVLVTVALDAMGLGLLIPVMPVLIQQLTGQGLAEAAVYGGWLTAVFAGVQFFAAPVLGSLSDHFGRRPVLLVSLCAFGLSYLLMSVAPSLAWLFLAQALTGLFGATPSTAGAYIADVTPREERTRRFGAMSAAFGSGLVIGPVMGGLLVSYHARLPFLAAAALSLVSVAYGYFVLPESLPRERRRPFSWRRANPVGAFREVRQYSGAALLLGAVLLQRVASGTMPAIWPYFTMELYRWSPQTVGWSLAAFGASTILAQAVLIRHFDQRFGSAGTACIGLLCLMAGYLGNLARDRVVGAFSVHTALYHGIHGWSGPGQHPVGDGRAERPGLAAGRAGQRERLGRHPDAFGDPAGVQGVLIPRGRDLFSRYALPAGVGTGGPWDLPYRQGDPADVPCRRELEHRFWFSAKVLRYSLEGALCQSAGPS
jgi:DHA1 family tetracycline resistance protein-like MFS transporter